jgi:hypothetical protein
MIWWFVVIFIVAMVVGYALMPRPQTQPPPGVNQIQVPTAEEGREIAVLFGEKYISGPNVVWYGDFRTVAIKKKGGKK